MKLKALLTCRFRRADHGPDLLQLRTGINLDGLLDGVR
jgi:hypothetical protein